MPSPVEARVRIRQKSPEIAIFVAATLLAAAAGAYGVSRSGLQLPLVPAFVMGLLVLARGFFPSRGTEGKVRIEDDGVHVFPVERARYGVHVEPYVLARKDVRTALYAPRARGGEVTIFGDEERPLLELEVAEEADGLALLDALGVGASKQRATFATESPFARPILAAGLGSLLLGWAGLYAGLSPVFALLGFAFALAFALWPGKVDVGPDGVATAWLARRRFVPWSKVDAVSTERSRSVLRLSGEKDVTLPRAAAGRGQSTDAMTRALDARLTEALEAHRAGRGSHAEWLGRGDRDVDTWLADLGRLRDGDGYRAAAIRDEDLWSVIEDPTAAADARVGAAWLLRRSLDDAGRARIRVASEAIASPRLRVALETAGDPRPDEEVEQVVAEQCDALAEEE